MISKQQIEADLITAMKAKDQLSVEVLRGLKTRVQNEMISKAPGVELSENDIIALVKNEVKRRKESANTYTTGGRAELAEKELAEAKVLEKYLPEQMSEEEIGKIIQEVLSANTFTAQDFGKAMGQVKAKVGNNADGALVAKILKEKLN
jgi:uncharacterized protein YqeY